MELASITVDRYQVSAYISELAKELARFAARYEMRDLACFLDMARIEARDRSVRPRKPARTPRS